MCERVRFRGPDDNCSDHFNAVVAMFNAVVAMLDGSRTGGDQVFRRLKSENITNSGGSTSMQLSNKVTAVKVACIDGENGVFICLCQDYWRMRNGGKDDSMQILIQPADGEDVYEDECPKPVVLFADASDCCKTPKTLCKIESLGCLKSCDAHKACA